MKIKQIYVPSDVKNPYVDHSYFYLLVNDLTKKAIAFDPGLFSPIDNFLQEQSLELTAILNTHHHPDHVGGNIQLQKKYGCSIYASLYDKKRVPGITHTVNPGETLNLIDTTIHTLDLKAHTLGLIGYYAPAKHALFPGDAIFSAGCGRLFEGTGKDLLESFKKIAELPKETLIYCSHEYTEKNIDFALTVDPTNKELKSYKANVDVLRSQKRPTIPCQLKTELQINPFFQVFNDSFLQAHNYENPVIAMTELRKLKDQF